MIKRYKQNETDKLAEILRNDGVISVPTDTVYGVCARINSEKAYNKLMKVKHRPSNKMFPIMCADKEQIKSIAIVNKMVEKIIDTFMPGPITIVLKSKIKIMNNPSDTIAVRMATSGAIVDLIRRVGCPIFMSSANQSSQPECKNLDEIEKNCPLLDGIMEGTVIFGQASTIVDCTTDEIRILRQGPISIEQLESV